MASGVILKKGPEITEKYGLEVSIRKLGTPLDFTYASFDMPVVSCRTVEILTSIAAMDIQTIPVKVNGQSESYNALNVTSRLPCISAERSDVQRWTEECGWPEKVGKPEMDVKLAIDPTAVGEHQVFRPEDWEVVVIVSDKVKDSLEQAQISGVSFRQV